MCVSYQCTHSPVDYIHMADFFAREYMADIIDEYSPEKNLIQFFDENKRTNKEKMSTKTRRNKKTIKKLTTVAAIHIELDQKMWCLKNKTRTVAPSLHWLRFFISVCVCPYFACRRFIFFSWRLNGSGVVGFVVIKINFTFLRSILRIR